jgi:hypothetical protein
MKINEWEFGYTGEAYDACQCDNEVKNGDVLICRDEKVVGIAGCWPIAVTKESGNLHSFAEDATLFQVLGQFEKDEDKDRALAGWKLAEVKAQELNFPLGKLRKY